MRPAGVDLRDTRPRCRKRVNPRHAGLGAAAPSRTANRLGISWNSLPTTEFTSADWWAMPKPALPSDRDHRPLRGPSSEGPTHGAMVGNWGGGNEGARDRWRHRRPQRGALPARAGHRG